MNNVSFYTIASMYIVLTLNFVLISCPYEFSREDQRPFFEQYDITLGQKTIVSQNNTEPKEEIVHEKK